MDFTRLTGMERSIREPQEDKFNEQIWLESLDGFDFEKLCAHIFRRLSYRVEETQDTGDMGRDLILHDKDGRMIVVECKHHLSKTIGRPTVQKLHSAVITSNANHGLLVTTGRFSPGAAAYARTVGIRLMDLHQLVMTAEQVGIKLLHGNKPIPGAYVAQVSEEILQAQLRNRLLEIVRSYPKPSKELIQLSLETIRLYPVYRITYDIHEDFVTQAGLIHQIHETGQTLYLTTLGELIPPRVGELAKKFWADCKMIPLAELLSLIKSRTPQIEGWPLRTDPFELDISSLIAKAKRIICNRYTKVIGYFGKNNVYYEKECQPSMKNVFIHDISPCYLSSWIFQVWIASHLYQFEVVPSPNKTILILPENLRCEICQRRFVGGALLVCNMCWHVIHDESCGFFCDTCNKTVCLSCSYWKYKTPKNKVRLCPECALQEAQQGKAVFP